MCSLVEDHEVSCLCRSAMFILTFSHDRNNNKMDQMNRAIIRTNNQAIYLLAQSAFNLSYHGCLYNRPKVREHYIDGRIAVGVDREQNH